MEHFLRVLPIEIQEDIVTIEEGIDVATDLMEVVLDFGRKVVYRFTDRSLTRERVVTEQDLEHVISRLGEFGDDDRAGVEGTLHRFSCIRNRKGRIIGMTCRVGRAISGTIEPIRDLVEEGLSILLLGPPGSGKTSRLREMAKVLAETKRVVVVDTSNEIAGDGDIPHPAIGNARRIQVTRVSEQHEAMQRAVENHMPEVIVVDEIGNELEAQAARTIAERGVQLIATAHGNTLEELMRNYALNDLMGGIQAVILGDAEARKRGTKKTVLERKAPPTFDVLVEILNRETVVVHRNLTEAVDAYLLGESIPREVRQRHDTGVSVSEDDVEVVRNLHRPSVRLFQYGLSRDTVEQAIRRFRGMTMTKNISEATHILAKERLYARGDLQHAEDLGIQIITVKSNNYNQVVSAVQRIAR